MTVAPLLRFNIQPVPKHDGVWVSDAGQVYRRDRSFVSCLTPRKATLGKNGYLSVNLKRKAGFVPEYVHRLVAAAFLMKRDGERYIRHLDGVRTNNQLANLRWGTAQQNADDRWAHGTMIYGENSPGAKVTESDIVEMRRMRREGATTIEIGRRFGINRRHAGDILAGRKWKWLKDAEIQGHP